MTNLIVLFGVSGSGKSYILQKLIEKYHFEYLCNDTLSQQVMDIAGVQRFSIANKNTWEKLKKRLNVNHAKYWLYENFFLKTKGDVCFTEGFLYFFEDERAVLESVVLKNFPHCKIHYIHLYPSLLDLNRNKTRRGQNHIDQKEYKNITLSQNLNFVSKQISNLDEMYNYIEQNKLINNLNKIPSWYQYHLEEFLTEKINLDSPHKNKPCFFKKWF